jgi:hypothetical protein
MSHTSFLDDKCGTLGSLLMIFLGVVEFVTQDLYDDTNDVVIEIPVCHRCHFFFPLISPTNFYLDVVNMNGDKL